MSTLEERIWETTEEGIKTKKIVENEKDFLSKILMRCTEENKKEDVKVNGHKEIFSKHKLENGVFVYVQTDEETGSKEIYISTAEGEKNFFAGNAYIHAGCCKRGKDELLSIRYAMLKDNGEYILDTGVGYDRRAGHHFVFSEGMIKGEATTVIEYIREKPEGSIEFELLRNDLNKIFEGTDREVKTYTDEEIAVMCAEKEIADLKVDKEDLKAENEILKKANANLSRENEELKEENSEQKQTIERNQKMLSKTLEFAKRVRESTVGKIFFKKPLKELNLDGTALPEGEER